MQSKVYWSNPGLINESLLGCFPSAIRNLGNRLSNLWASFVDLENLDAATLEGLYQSLLYLVRRVTTQSDTDGPDLL